MWNITKEHLFIDLITSCTCLYIPAHLLQCLLINALFVYLHLYSSLVTNLRVTILFMLNCMLFIRRKFVSHWLWLHSWKRSQTITTTNEAEQGNGNGEKVIVWAKCQNPLSMLFWSIILDLNLPFLGCLLSKTLSTQAVNFPFWCATCYDIR